MKPLKFPAILISCLLILPGCFEKTKTVGHETEVYVIADEDTWLALEQPLMTAFQRTINTPQPENVFDVYWVEPDKFNEFAQRKNLVLVGTLNADGKISQQVTNMLSREVKAKVVDGSAFVFPKEDPWAQNQLLLVLAGNSNTELAEKLEGNKEYLYNLFMKRLIKETEELMFSKLEQKDLSRKILDKFGWTLRIQHDYITNIERAQEKFYMLRRSLPGRERWLFVHWIDDADPAIINQEWILNMRDRLTTRFYKADSVNRDPHYLKSYEKEIANRLAVVVEGLWENTTEVVGGPFRTYAFYDEKSGRIYMIDISVYSPAGTKEPFLRQLEVMANTFQTADDIKKQEIKEAS